MSTKNDKQVLNSILNPNLPIGEAIYDENIPSELVDVEEDCKEVQRSKELELEGARAAEEGDILKSIKLFSEAIEIAPFRPSCYNNRAQALRLNGQNDKAYDDLNNAIAMGYKQKGKAVCQAYCQRALINRLNGNEDGAREDFTAASRLGSQFAKSQLVAMNPYAAMCNNMLTEVMRKLQEGEQAEF